ncbi:hypothetical protein [Methylocucumis oryzae]|uniref:Uncharacterized protein n=1 Tax=Methylocucumis oryzae TaxID=1632867 RepID=A0A0F3IL17_9GAMM|nr:hypothetical protein [Methylocucumis oryzae]KJV07435.1 hypothetical protein VZ94_04715 [Methylocucumis oryzae]
MTSKKPILFYANLAAENETVAPILPMDSGQISIAAQEELLLDGEFKVDSSGRGARMDIAANRLKIVNALSATPTQGTLEILADDITQLGVDSLFLGGTRSIDKTSGDTNINVVSSEVVFDTNAKVSVTDLVVAASDKVEVLSGAEINASGKVNTGDSVFNVTGDSALLRVSADKQITLNHTADSGASGDLLIRDGALLTAEQSMLLDSSKTTVVAGDIVMDGGALSIKANSINIGDVTGLPDTALNLSNDKLAKLTVDQLALTSREAINFYGDVGLTDASGQLSAISFDELKLNAAGFVGHGNSEQVVKLAANTLQIENSANAELTQAGSGQQRLEIAANQYQQGEGDFAITGFDKINLNVAQGINAVGDATVTVSGDTTLSAGYITGTGGKLLTF